jgi:hypothetical protein
MTDEQRRIIAEARRTLAAAPEPYTPPLHYKTHEPPPQPEPERDAEPKLDTATPVDMADYWREWEDWLAARLTVERKVIARFVAEAIAKCVGDERDKLRAEIHEQRIEQAKLSSALSELHNLLASERAKIVDLPPLLSRRDFN